MAMKIPIIALMAIIALSLSGCCTVTEVPASEDIYVDLNSFEIHNTDRLRCDAGNISNLTIVQFNLSEVNITEGDIVVLALKSALPQERAPQINALDDNDSSVSGMLLLPTVSFWTENSGIEALLISMQSMAEIVLQEGLNLGKVSICFDGDGILAFDVSKSVKDAKAKGDKISFLLGAFSFSSYSASFKSRETGEGPYLVIMPYPFEAGANLSNNETYQTDLTAGESMDNKTANEMSSILNQSDDFPVVEALDANSSLSSEAGPLVVNPKPQVIQSLIDRAADAKTLYPSGLGMLNNRAINAPLDDFMIGLEPPDVGEW